MNSPLLKVAPSVLLLSMSACSNNFFTFKDKEVTPCLDSDGQTITCEQPGPQSVGPHPVGPHPVGPQTSEQQIDNVVAMKKRYMADIKEAPELHVDGHYSQYNSNVHFVPLSDYVEQMALDISHDLVGSNIRHPIAVASFVHLDASLQNTDYLGNQIAEHFITELREMGLAVNDYKVTGNISVTPMGDFAFSRDIDELKDQQNAGYVLTGTMTKQPTGTLISARVVGLTSNTVLASSSKFVPNLML